VFKVPPLPRTLSAALRDARAKKLEVRISAVRDLARLATGSDREVALGALVRSLGEDAEPRVRAEAALALADAQAREHIAALLDAAQDDAPWVQQMAVLALGEVSSRRDETAYQTLVRALQHDLPAMRFQALIALARVDGDQPARHLSRGFEDSDAEVRYVAIRLTEERWIERKGGNSLPSELARRVRTSLRDGEAKVRLAAAILLAKSGDLSGVDAIVAAVDRGEGAEELEDAQAAVELAGRLGLKAARRGLTRRAWGRFGILQDPCSFQARIALAQLGDLRAVQSIIRDLSAWSRDTRTLAVVAAGRAGLADATRLIRAMRGDARRADPEAVDEALAALQRVEE